jgi:ribonuclease BN (tRNA processing enzyme)
VDRLLLTHLHGDHVAGWPFVLLALDRQQRRRRPFDVWGPRGTAERLTALTRACYDELLAADGLGFELRVHELDVAAHEGIDLGGGVWADVVPLDHHPSSLGWRLSGGGVTLAITGDTRWCPGLSRLVAGAGIAVVECTSVGRLDGHLSLDELRERRDELAAERLVLVHLTDAVALALAADPVPGVMAAHDGMRVPLTRP